MNHLIHTAGPLHLREGGYRWTFQIETLNVPVAHVKATHTDRSETNANARLLAAAYNAFDSAGKKLGVNAVELAERMAEGGIADLVSALGQAREHIDGEIDVVDGSYGEPAPNAAMTLADEIDRALAKMPGGAS